MARVAPFAIIPFKFDFSELLQNLINEVIREMPGNNGQEVLVEDLILNMKVQMRLDLLVLIVPSFGRGFEFEVLEAELNEFFYQYSSHPEAIEIIMQTAEDIYLSFYYMLTEIANNFDEVGGLDFEGIAGTPSLLTSDSFSNDQLETAIYKSGGQSYLKFLKFLSRVA